MKRVMVGLSGGVDSSVTAALLQQQGYEVSGAFMVNWTQDVGGVRCPWEDDLADAQRVAAHLDIPFRTFDYQAEYKQLVVDTMVAEYRAGRTPNPDILCNQEIKFKLFLSAALDSGADLIATGHYARTEGGRLYTAADTAKDQTYFLYRVRSEALQKTLMPIGDYHKPAVRQLAAKYGLPTAAKKDSQGICFIGPVGLKPFLQQYIPPRPGDIVLGSSGQVVGQHDGAAYYTIGQRHGLGAGGGQPYYVAGKDIDQNIVYVTTDPTELERDGQQFRLTDPHWIHQPPTTERLYQIRVRYRSEPIAGHLTASGNHWQVTLDQPARALAAGQSAVVYDGPEVLGGGLIQL